jgi:nucleoside-diphosphate-sugar epimerase
MAEAAAAMLRGRVRCPLCGKERAKGWVYYHLLEHVHALAEKGVVEVVRFSDGTPCFRFQGRWYLSVSDLVDALARAGVRE